MKEKIDFTTFCNRFKEYNRDDNFSYEGKRALFDYLEEFEESTEEEIELDIIALCCEYSEFEDLNEFWKSYNKETYPNFETIENHTTLIKINDESFIIQQF